MAILGVKTLRGREIKETLERSKLEVGKIFFYDSSVESEWSLLTEFRGEPYGVKYPTEDIFKGAKVILLASSGDIELKTVSKAEKEGFFVIYLSNSFNEDEKFKIENSSPVAFQPVSEYQEEGVEEFINQTVAILNATSVQKKILKEQQPLILFSRITSRKEKL